MSDTTATSPSAPPPNVTPQSQGLDAAWMQSLFPTKDDSKREGWLKILLDHEFETTSDLEGMSDADWESLGFPLAVKNKLKEATKQAQQTTTTSEPLTPSSSQISVVPSITPSEPRELTQVECVVMDVSGSMRARSNIDPDKTREDVSKLLFHTLVDKLVGLEMDHALGLIAFGSSVTPIGITTEYERFHDELGRLDANQNRTMLYDAIFEAAKQIDEYVTTHCASQKVQPVKRVFALTDGQDNASTRAPWQVAQFLQQKEITLDAIPVAGHNAPLQSMTAATTAGLCFEVVSQEQGVGLFEREAVLHVAYREATDAPPPINNMADLAALEKKIEKTAPVTDLRSAVAPVVHAPVLTSVDVQQRAASSGLGASGRRIMKEYNDAMKDPPSNISFFISAQDMSSWKVLLVGPEKSIYEGGTWLCTVQFPTDYPFQPPKVRFVTPIYHCNVNGDGAICLDILKDQWSPALTISKVFLSIANLLTDPNPDDPLDAYKGQLYKDNRDTYMVNARDHTKKHASLTFVEMVKTYNLSTA